MAESVTMTVRVRGLRLATFRLRCALVFIWLAARIGGTGFRVDVDTQSQDL